MQNVVDALAAVNLQFGTGSSPQEKLRDFLERTFAKDLPYAGALRLSTALERLLQLFGTRRDVDVTALAHITAWSEPQPISWPIPFSRANNIQLLQPRGAS